MKLNIYWCTDERYFYQTSISVFSLLLHKREEDKAHLNILSYKPLKEKKQAGVEKSRIFLSRGNGDIPPAGK